jgi:RNA polymerase sigma-70 factor, ECF subfamily
MQELDYAEIIRLNYSALYARAFGLARDRDSALDLVQDTFERCLRRFPAQLPSHKVRSWLLVILTNLFRDSRRARANRGRASMSSGSWQDLPAPTVEDPPLWRLVDEDEVRACMGSLGASAQQVFRLHAEGVPNKEIACRLAIPATTVGTRLFRARQDLREMLAGGAAPARCRKRRVSEADPERRRNPPGAGSRSAAVRPSPGG